MPEVAKAFMFLQDSIPQWLQEVTKVEEKAIAMQDEVIKVITAVKKKSESLKSQRPPRLLAVIKEAVPSHGDQSDMQRNSDDPKTHSFQSSRATGPSQFVSKQMVIVNYDGDMQKSFESIVRAIGTGRNMLRKAKMEAKVKELSALAGSSEDEDEDEDEDDEDQEGDDPTVLRTSYRPRMTSIRADAARRRTGQPGAGKGPNTSMELLNTTDKLLESAQGLCERAAYLTLREGDCRKEIGRVRKHFDYIFATAKLEVGRCRAKKSQDMHELPDVLAQDTSDTSVYSVEPSCKLNVPPTVIPPAEPAHQLKVKLPEVAIRSIPAAPNSPRMEVDEEDEDVDFIMPPIRLTSQMGRRK